MDEGKLLEAQSRAARVQQLLEDEILSEAYDRLEAELISAWIGTPARDTDGRERCWTAIQANRKHKGYLEAIVTNGKLAKAELTELAKTAERNRLFGR